MDAIRGRVLITGASGFLGGHLCVVAAREWEVFGTYLTHLAVPGCAKPVRLDLSDAGGIGACLDDLRPDAVVLAAVLQVDACEADPAAARVVNTASAAAFSRWCARHNRRLIYVSSDMVFDGLRGMYAEVDLPEPLLVYGRTKLAAEKHALEILPEACVVRLPLMYGFPAAGGTCFFAEMLARLERGERVTVFCDQYRCAGLVGNMAEAVVELVASAFRGVMHVAGTERCSRADLAREACRLGAGSEELLDVIPMRESALAVPRPRDLSMSVELASRQLKTRLIGYRDGLRFVLAD